MSNLHQWIIVAQILLTSGGGLCGDDDREHVHIKVHIPEVNRRHTHIRKVQKHIYHPKKVVKVPEFHEIDLDTTPFGLMSYGVPDHDQNFQYSDIPGNVPVAEFPEAPYGVDNTLEATVLKKPKVGSIQALISEGVVSSKVHGIKKPIEFLGAHHALDMHKFTSPSVEDVSDDYATGPADAVMIDQKIAGSAYPYMMMGGSYKPKWPTYSSIFETSVKPYSSGRRWAHGSPPDWLSPSLEDDYMAFESFSPTTMHIAKVKPLPSSRVKFDKHEFDRQHVTETYTMQKKKKPKPEKRRRTPSPAFRINY